MPDQQPIHTPEGKAHFIQTVCDRLRDGATERIPAMPQEWDGHELRLYLAQLFSDEVTSHISQGKRRREYQNTIATTAGL